MSTIIEQESELRDYLEEQNFDNKSTKLVLDSIDEKYGLDITVLTNKIFKNPTKKLRKFTMSLFSVSNPDINVLNLIKILSFHLDLNVDLILNHCKAVDRSRESRFLTVGFTKELLKIYPEERVIQLVLKDQLRDLNDIIYMFKKIKEERELNFLPSKPSNFKDIHDSLTRMSLKLESKDFNLEQRDDILKLDNTKINNGLIIRVPKTHYDLVDLGEDLNFCIGNGMYSEEVKNGRCSIVSIYNEKQKPVYGVQFNRYAISQAYGLDNKRLPDNILLDLQKALISEPVVPSDFISISDSKWINGFKYNDKDLYIMMNHIIYVYFDVEKEVYEELITSTRKGTYVNQIIKSNYKFQKIG